MRDLTNRNLIILKGALFVLLGLLSTALLIVGCPTWKRAVLLAIAIWSWCRFYYFCFYVIERYVDSSYRFSGLFSAIRYLLSRANPHP